MGQDCGICGCSWCHCAERDETAPPAEGMHASAGEVCGACGCHSGTLDAVWDMLEVQCEEDRSGDFAEEPLDWDDPAVTALLNAYAMEAEDSFCCPVCHCPGPDTETVHRVVFQITN